SVGDSDFGTRWRRIRGLVGYYARAHFRAGGEFCCRLDDERFTCVSPVGPCGDSFDLPLDEIVKIEREDWGETTAAGTSGTYVENVIGFRVIMTTRWRSSLSCSRAFDPTSSGSIRGDARRGFHDRIRRGHRD